MIEVPLLLPTPPKSSWVFSLAWVAEAPASHIVELAKAEVADNANPSRAMVDFAKIPLEHAEEGCHEVFLKYGFAAPIEIEKLNLGLGSLSQFPFLKFSSWAQFLLDRGQVPMQMCGCKNLRAMRDVLGEFWKRYKALHPNHQLFQIVQGDDERLRRTIPVYSHTDEGRTYKHEALFVLSTHSCLGRGTSSYVLKGKHALPLRRRGLGLNFIGSTWSTHFLSAVLLHEVEKENPGVLAGIVAAYAQDMSSLATHGLSLDSDGDANERIYFQHVGTKGDLPALAKIGSFKRTHSHVARQPQSRTPCQGICYLCLAGQEQSADGRQPSIPWEDTALNPAWAATVDQVLPWDGRAEPVILRGLPIDPTRKARFFLTDIWHNFHLGLSKHFWASSVVSLIERLPLLQAMTIEAAIKHLSDDYSRFWKQRKMNPLEKEINREVLSWPYGRVCPVGKWSKGSTATAFMQWLEDFCTRCVVHQAHDELLLIVEPCH